MARRSVLALFAFLGVLLVGCQRGGAQPTMDPDLIVFSTFTPDALGESPSVVSPADQTEVIDDLAAWVESALVDSSPEAIVAELEEMGYGLGAGSVVREDLNGDEAQEWVVVIRPQIGAINQSGLFAILESSPPAEKRWSGGATREGDLRQSYHVAYHWAFPGHSAVSELLTVQDISGDTREDVLFHEAECDEGGCLSNFLLVSYHGSETPSQLLYTDLMGGGGGGPGAFTPTLGEAEWSLRDWNGDGTKELLLLGHFRLDQSGGPQRGIVDIYEFLPESTSMPWDGGAWLPTSVRYFRLRDGDLLITREMYPEAVAVLEEVIHSDTLTESMWGDAPSEPRDEKGDVRRFAYLRLIQAALLVGDRPLAARYQGEMAAEWPSHPLTGLADYLIYADPTDFWAGCQKVTSVARAIPDLTGMLSFMGNNPPITGEQFCPTRRGGDVQMPLLLPGIDYDPAILP